MGLGNKVPEANELNFGNLNRVQINFVEMNRQKLRITEIGDECVNKLSSLASAVSALAALVDAEGYSDTSMSIKITTFKNYINIIAAGMNDQIAKYSTLNEEMTQEVVNTLNSLIQSLYDEHGQYNPNLSYVNEVGEITNISYNKALNNAWANQGPMYPNFTNSDAWINNNLYAQNGLTGQCTWFAAGRFYELYGYEPGFGGSGYQCVGELLEAHPDNFYASDTPVAGAVFSGYATANNPHGHVGIILSIDESTNTIVYQDGNYDGYSNSFEKAQTDWKTVTMSIDDFYSRWGRNFANPNIPIKFEDNGPTKL